MSRQTRCVLMLLLASMIWGMAFVAQTMGAGMDALSFLSGRSWLGFLVLAPAARIFDFLNEKQGKPVGRPVTREQKRILWVGGISCGLALFAATAVQQYAVTLDPTTAKASFLTAMYVVLVPVAGLFLGKGCHPSLWLCVVLAVGGMYLLCMGGGMTGLLVSDLIYLLGAALFTVQILLLGHFAPLTDGVRLSMLQFLTVSVLSTLGALLFSPAPFAGFWDNLGPILYCGILSSGVAYTLQVLGQAGLSPALASLAMCTESVFGALGGWLILGQGLTGRELAGCGLIFAAVVLAQLPMALPGKKSGAVKEG